jgi:hypothetical protein
VRCQDDQAQLTALFDAKSADLEIESNHGIAQYLTEHRIAS